MSNIEMKVGEGKWIKFTVTRSGTILDLSGKSLLFGVKENQDDEDYLLAISGEPKINMASANSGEVYVNVTSSETTTIGTGNFVSALKIVISGEQDVDISDNIPFILTTSVIG
jgi:hypothetical protein